MSHQLGDAPIEQRYRKTMNRLARHVDRWLNPGKRGKERKVGFVMLVFEFGDTPGRCNYISNGADRDDVVTLMKEQIARFEGRVPDSTTQH